MKHAWISVAGILVGVSAALGLLYVNPLIGEPDPEFGAFDSLFRYEFPAEGLVLMTHAGTVPLPMHPEGVPELWENTIRTTAFGLVALSSETAGPAVVASKAAVPSRRTELLSSGVIVNDYWLVTFPGEGSLFVLGDSNVWPLVRDHFLPVSVLNRPWRGARSYRTTNGPGVRGTALALGATGRFAGREGSAVERFHVNGYSRAHGVESFSGELHLRIVEPDAAGER